MTDVMVDLETMGNGVTAAIVSIGAAEFDPMGDGYGRTFLVNIELASAVAHGLQVDGETVVWWLDQEAAARKALLDPPPVSLSHALWQFSTWYPNGAKLWSHATFDAPILSNAYRAVKKSQPWKFRDARDIRTVVDLAGIDSKAQPSPEGHIDHRADHDAIRQVALVQACLREIRQRAA